MGLSGADSMRFVPSSMDRAASSRAVAAHCDPAPCFLVILWCRGSSGSSNGRRVDAQESQEAAAAAGRQGSGWRHCCPPAPCCCG
jgi:hypothetical protein